MKECDTVIVPKINNSPQPRKIHSSQQRQLLDDFHIRGISLSACSA